MSELQEVLQAIEEGGARGEPMALATIVQARGSTYRREGARYLVRSEGRPVGTISGGCLEGDVRDVAAQVMADGRPRLLHFDLTADDEVVWGWGLGCNGVIDVFVEPAAGAVQAARAIRRAVEEQRPLAVITVVEAEEDRAAPGARLVVHLDGSTEGSLGHPGLDERAKDEALAALEQERSRLVELGEGVRAFVEAVVPPIRLLVCGAGHDAVPLVRYAAGLGWRVEVVDDRENFLKPTRFPEAARFVRAEPLEAARAAGVDERTYVVVMSHNFLRDKDYLRSFLGSPAPYIGMLGPRARLEKLLEELRREGYEPRPQDLEVVHGPAGLDLGSEGPEEVAWAIVGEILAVRNRRRGGFLKDRKGPIHDRPAEEVAPGAR
ncbi:MAG TPA: XdhC family protein [Actinomycetota bacterium]|nr:XdhC family protein [Actinomycetota bacterium]